MNTDTFAPRRAKKSARIVLTSFGVLAAAAVAQAQIEIRSAYGSAPNVFGSPSYAPWQRNALTALLGGLKAAGDVTMPSYFEARERFDASELAATSFPSWLGKADPATAYGSAFANELGNRLTLVSLIRNLNGTQVDIANGLTRDLRYPRSLDTQTRSEFFYSSAIAYSTATNYTASIVGVTKGPDGILGTSDDVFQTSGSGPVDAILVTTPGFAEANSNDGTSQQGQIEEITEFVRYYQDEGALFGQVGYGGTSNAATAVFNPKLPVDLNGTYVAGTAANGVQGTSTATTAPSGDPRGYGKVVEQSKNASPAALEGALTPFSDAVKPPSSLSVDLTNRTFAFNVDLGDSSRWSDAVPGAGQVFVAGTGARILGAAGAAVWVSFHREGTNWLISIQNSDGATSSQTLYLPVERHRYRVVVLFNSTTATAQVAQADGGNIGQVNGISVALPSGIDLTNSVFSTGFLNNSQTNSPIVKVSGFSTDGIVDTMYAFADNPYVKPGASILFSLGTNNLRSVFAPDGLESFQAFLQTIGTGSESYGQSFLVGSPFSTFVRNGSDGGTTFASAIGIYNGNDNDYQNFPSGGNSVLAKIYEVAGSSSGFPNVVGLGILAQNGNGNQTRFSIDDGTPLVPTRVGSNSVVIDNAAPVIGNGGVYQGNAAVTTAIQGATQLRFSAADSQGTYSGLEGVPTAKITFHDGTTQALNVYAGDSSVNGYLADLNLTSATPNGAATITLTATDRVGNVTTQSVPFNVNVAQITIQVTVQGLNPSSGVYAGSPYDNVATRAVQFTVGGAVGSTTGSAALSIVRNVDFVASNTATVTLTALDGIQPGQNYTMVSAKDNLHTLRRIGGLTNGGSAQFSASLSLVSGDANNDNVIDVLDYAIFASRNNQQIGQDTPTTFTGTRHPDFTGDGSVRTQDGTFISGANFLASGDALPGNFAAMSVVKGKAKTAATIRDLVAAGIDFRTAMAMDLDHNGVVTMSEIAAWMTTRR